MLINLLGYLRKYFSSLVHASNLDLQVFLFTGFSIYAVFSLLTLTT